MKSPTMIAGLPLAAWLLIVVAVVPALVLVAVFYAAHRRHDDAPGRDGQPVAR